MFTRNRHIEYEFEINIFFDNAFEARNSAEHHSADDNMQRWKVLNPWVNSFLSVLRTVLEKHHLDSVYDQGQVFVTPYGGRIIYSIYDYPVVIHLKDADFVQKGKRWSQVRVYVVTLIKRGLM